MKVKKSNKLSDWILGERKFIIGVAKTAGFLAVR